MAALFVYGSHPHVPDYMVRGETTCRIITDSRNSPRLVLDASSGEVLQRMDYDAFGQVLLDTMPGFQPLGFAGGLYDPDTGLVHLGARSYDPRVGRWTARSPILFMGGSANLFTYVDNDPVNRSDPTGLGIDEGDPGGRHLLPPWLAGCLRADPARPEAGLLVPVGAGGSYPPGRALPPVTLVRDLVSMRGYGDEMATRMIHPMQIYRIFGEALHVSGVSLPSPGGENELVGQGCLEW